MKLGAMAAQTSDVAIIPNLLVLDADWRILIAAATDIWDSAGIRVQVGGIVPAVLRALVEVALESLGIDRSKTFCARIMPWSDIAITIYTVATTGAPLLALSAHRFRARANLRFAQREYGLSPRELEILRLVLRGSNTNQIAAALSIADSTVIAHIKSLLMKTRAANRAALVARVLGWAETLAT